MSWAETLFLRNVIKSHRTYAASDSVLAVLGTNIDKEIVGGDPRKIDGITLTPTVSGSLRVSATLTTTSMSSIASETTLYVYEDDVLIAQDTILLGSSSLKGTGFVDFEIKKDKTYTFYTKRTRADGPYQTLKDIKLCGHVVDLSMLKYTTN